MVTTIFGLILRNHAWNSWIELTIGESQRILGGGAGKTAII